MRNWLKLVKPDISDSSESHSSQTSDKLVEVDSSIALTSRNGNPLQNDKITVTQQVGVESFKNNHNPSLIHMGKTTVWLRSSSLSPASVPLSFCISCEINSVTCFKSLQQFLLQILFCWLINETWCYQCIDKVTDGDKPQNILYIYI